MSINVIALGGNAILEKDASDRAQKETVRKAAQYISDFILGGEKVAICHGNGPQVGNILLQQQAAESVKNPQMALDTCVAMTEGSIGYWIQNALSNEFLKKNMPISVVSMVTQVVVSEKDSSFNNPTKPIGPFYTEEEMQTISRQSDAVFKEDAGRGFRKVVASPMPLEIVEKQAIKNMIAANIIPVCAGGGGVPVILKGNQLNGVEAVNDKDFSAEVLAENINADRLIILTAVENIYINFNKSNQQALSEISVSDAEGYINEGQFAAGSMLPKIEAAVKFVKGYPNRRAVITSIDNLNKINEGNGTIVVDR